MNERHKALFGNEFVATANKKERKWWPLDAGWQAIHFIAKLHNQKKDKLASTRAWAGTRDNDPSAYKSHWYGLLGEVVYSLETKQLVNFEEIDSGDSGSDFPDGYDTKAVTIWDDPWLKVPTKTHKWPEDGFAVIALNIDKREGKLIGWATIEMIKSAGVRVWNHDAGPQYSIPPHELLDERPEL